MNLIKKNAQGYGYKYTDLAEINTLLASNGVSYYQYIEPLDGVDYIMTVPITKDGEECPPVRGCRVVEASLTGKSNPAQEYGAAITYCRRYSLLMAFGLATTDDDAASLTAPEKITAKEVKIYEAMCQRLNIDPQSLFGDGHSYKDMTPATYAKIMKEFGGR